MEYKAIQLEMKEIADDGRTVTGIAAVFGNIDSGYDRIFKGAFKKTLKENTGRVKHLWMHDPFQPPTAVVKELKEVGAAELPATVRERYPEATGGLLVVRKYLDTPRGNEILSGIRDGALSEMSFAYDPLKYDFEPDKDGLTTVRNLRELRLWETSDVVWGMNDATVASKSFDFRLDQLERLAADLRDTAGPDGKAGRVLSARNLTRLKEALAVLSDILLAAEPPDEDDDDGKSRRVLALTEQIRMRLAIAERELVW